MLINRVPVLLASFLTTQEMILLISVAVGGPIIALLLYFFMVKKNRKPLDYNKAQEKLKLYGKMYRFLVNFRPTKAYIKRIAKKFSLLSVYSQDEIKYLTAKSFLRLLWASTITFTLSTLVFDDIMTVLLTTIGIHVVVNVGIERRLENATLIVYKQLKETIASIRIEFKKSKGDVIVAVENAKVGSLLAPIMNELKQILVSPMGDEALEYFFEQVPFKQAQTLAMICYNINNSGDEEDEYGNSVFDEALLLMNNDINQKIEEINYERQRYDAGIPVVKNLEYLALLGIVAAVALQAVMTELMPSVATLYNGLAGLVIRNGIILYSIYAYNTVARAHMRSVVRMDDRPQIVETLMRKEKVQKFVLSLMPTDDVKKRLMRRNLKLAFSAKSLEDHYCQKFVYATVAFIFTACLTIIAPFLQIRFTQNYIYDFGLMADTKIYEDKKGNLLYDDQYVLDVDNTYINMRTGNEEEDLMPRWEAQDDMDHQEILQFVKEKFPTFNDLKLEDQVKRLETKFQDLKNTTYHFWYIFVAFAVAFIAWKFPDRELKKRLSLAKEEEEEEFLQLQMVTMILASMNCDTYDTLRYLTQIAEFHKDTLAYCCYCYPSDPMGALEKMEEQVQSENFKIFIGKLKETVEYLSVKEAFADLRSDRVHICNERDIYIKANIDRLRGRMGGVALRPMYMAVFGMLVAPLVYTGYTQLTEVMEEISTI